VLFALQLLMTCTFVASEASTRTYDNGRGGRPCGELIGSDPTPTKAVNAWLRECSDRRLNVWLEPEDASSGESTFATRRDAGWLLRSTPLDGVA
jgi:hypothetical protein